MILSLDKTSTLLKYSDLCHVELSYTSHPDAQRVLTPEAVDFVVGLHRTFQGRRLDLLARRAECQARFDAGERPDFLPETAHIRDQ